MNLNFSSLEKKKTRVRIAKPILANNQVLLHAPNDLEKFRSAKIELNNNFTQKLLTNPEESAELIVQFNTGADAVVFLLSDMIPAHMLDEVRKASIVCVLQENVINKGSKAIRTLLQEHFGLGLEQQVVTAELCYTTEAGDEPLLLGFAIPNPTMKEEVEEEYELEVESEEELVNYNAEYI